MIEEIGSGLYYVCATFHIQNVIVSRLQLFWLKTTKSHFGATSQNNTIIVEMFTIVSIMDATVHKQDALMNL